MHTLVNKFDSIEQMINEHGLKLYSLIFLKV